MNNWEDALIGPDATLREALHTIDRLGSQIVLVVDAQRRLLGTLSDGDARRALLDGSSMVDSVRSAMHSTPTYGNADDDRAIRLATMRELGLHQLPLVNLAGVVVGLDTVNDYLRKQERDQWVVIMAGGLGSRLKELTRATPKPMLQVGPRPLIETILRGFSIQGFRNFYLAVNYKSDQIERFLGDGSKLGIHIHYLREDRRLGTAGALSLLPECPSQPVLVTNADLLTKENYGFMLDQHIEANADLTMAVREYDMQVPFGVVRERDGCMVSIDEKPTQRFTVSAGTYVLSPHVLELIPRSTFFDMPALSESAINQGLRARCHRIDGYWLDIGRLPDYERANLEFDEVFN